MANHQPSGHEGSDGDPRAALLDMPPIASGRRLGARYVLERPLGHGGMAVVWLATDERLQRPVAIKVLSDTLAADDAYLVRFRREARVAAGLQHPNLVGVYDFDAGVRPYLVMEYVSGGDLSECLAAGKSPEPRRLARELLAALHRIHAAGVLHRDIKPQNVLLDADGRARLTDFGIAQPHDAASLTRTGQVIGTERYIAPEVMAGEPASERSDLFGLGVVLAEAAEGRGDVALRALTERLRDPDPARRPESAAAALAALERGPVLAGTPTQPYAVEELEPTESPPATGEAPPYRPFEPTMTRARRAPRRWAVAALAAVALAAAAALAIALATQDGSGGDSGGSSSRPAERGAGERSASGDNPGVSDNQGAAVATGGAPAPTTTEESAAAAPSDSAAAPSDSAAAPSDSDSSGGAPTDGASLNDQGFALVREGRYEEAIPSLEQAVDALEGSGDEQTYNYALYNLATAYLGAGRPQEAIPLLEERMQYDDGQLDTVQATLDEAYAAAGQRPPSEEGAGG